MKNKRRDGVEVEGSQTSHSAPAAPDEPGLRRCWWERIPYEMPLRVDTQAECGINKEKPP